MYVHISYIYIYIYIYINVYIFDLFLLYLIYTDLLSETMFLTSSI